MIQPRGRDINHTYLSRNFKISPKFIQKVASSLEQDQQTNKVYENIEDQNILDEVNLVQILVDRTGFTEQEVLDCLAKLVEKSKLAFSAASRSYYKDASIIS